MDPKELLRNLLQGIKDGNRQDVAFAAASLADWIGSGASGGFLPTKRELEEICTAFSGYGDLIAGIERVAAIMQEPQNQDVHLAALFRSASLPRWTPPADEHRWIGKAKKARKRAARSS